MANHTSGWLIGLATAMALWSGAAAAEVGPAVDTAVNDCAFHAGVKGTYYVSPIRYGKVDAYAVPPGGGVSAAQSKKINACVAKAVQGQPVQRATPVVTRRAAAPGDTQGCLAQYQNKLRSTDGGRTYRGSGATRLVSGLFGRGMGRRLIENEYDRCLNRIAYAGDRCPTGVFTGGAGYCIRRPVW